MLMNSIYKIQGIHSYIYIYMCVCVCVCVCVYECIFFCAYADILWSNRRMLWNVMYKIQMYSLISTYGYE